VRWLLGSLLASCAVLWAPQASAAEPSCDATALRAEAHRARVWRYTWSGINAGLMVGAFVAVPLVERESRPDWIVPGIGSGVTVLATWIWPLRVEGAAEDLEELPSAEQATALPRLMRESAEDEQDRITWPWHLANFGLSAAGGAVIAFGFKHYVSGAITAAAGTALGEVQILTQPTSLPATCPTACRLTPRLSFTPRADAVPASWSLALGGAF
jgi:hypothetical protein